MEGGAAIAGLQDAATQQGAMAGGQEVSTRFEQDQREHEGLMQAVGTGYGIDALADSGYEGAARGATQESVADARLDFANEMRRHQRNQNIAGTIVGAALGGWGAAAAGGSAAAGAASGAASTTAASENYALSSANEAGTSDGRYDAQDMQALHDATYRTARGHERATLEQAAQDDQGGFWYNVVRSGAGR